VSRRDRPRAEPPATITAVSAGGRRVDFPDAPITIREGDRLAVAVADGGDIAISIGESAPTVDTYERATLGGMTVPPVSDAPTLTGRPLGPITFTLDAEPVYPRAAVPPSGAVWNGIRRAWLVPGPDGALVVADPQPPPPERSFTTGKPAADVPPSVKISA
jgi:hypothetical protein